MKGITGFLDMRWQMQSSGNIYNSLSGHSFLGGGRTSTIWGSRDASSARPTKKLKRKTTHKCAWNYDGFSKGMERTKAVDLVAVDLVISFETNYAVFLHTLVSDNDSTLQLVLEHSYKNKFSNNQDMWPKSKDCHLLRDTGKLPLHITHLLREFWKLHYTSHNHNNFCSLFLKLSQQLNESCNC